MQNVTNKIEFFSGLQQTEFYKQSFTCNKYIWQYGSVLGAPYLPMSLQGEHTSPFFHVLTWNGVSTWKQQNVLLQKQNRNDTE